MAKNKSTQKADPPFALHLESDRVFEVKGNQTNAFAQTFHAGVGEVVLRFKNFTGEKKHFIFSVVETDADGKRVAIPDDAIVSDAQFKNEVKVLSEESPKL